MLFALVAGLFGATGSYISKLLSQTLQLLASQELSRTRWINIPILVAGVLATNVAMWYCFSMSLKKSRNTVTATGLNLASNFSLSVGLALTAVSA